MIVRDIVRWWWSWRALLLLVGAIVGWAYGAWESPRQAKTYVAEATVFVRDQRARLQSLADRAGINIALPEELPVVIGYDNIGGGRVLLRATSASSDEAVRKIEAQILQAHEQARINDLDLAPYVEYLRAAGVSDFALQPVRRLEVVKPPQVSESSHTVDLSAVSAIFGVVLVFALGTLGLLLGRELENFPEDSPRDQF